MKSFFNWCRRYISIFSILIVSFLCYMLFWQDNSAFRYMEYTRTIDSLRVEIQHATDTMLHYRHLNEQLNSNPEAMERVVREQYHMVKPGEDVYVFE